MKGGFGKLGTSAQRKRRREIRKRYTTSPSCRILELMMFGTIKEIFGEWNGACTNRACSVCFDTQSNVYRMAGCPTRKLEDKVVAAGDEFDYLGQRAETLKRRAEQERRAGDEP